MHLAAFNGESESLLTLLAHKAPVDLGNIVRGTDELPSSCLTYVYSRIIRQPCIMHVKTATSAPWKFFYAREQASKARLWEVPINRGGSSPFIVPLEMGIQISLAF